MSTVNFPNNPTDGQIFEIPGRAWQWSEDDEVWKALFGTLATLIEHGSTHHSSGTDAIEITPTQVTGTAVVHSDSRLTDSRTPHSHATSHSSTGSDPITIAQSQVTNLTTDLSGKAPAAAGVATGGTTGQVLSKTSNVNYETEWSTLPIPPATPAGVISQFAGASAPEGYLLCTGQSVSTTTYSDLFAAIGYAYGGSGSNFNIPNLQNRVPVGKGPDAEFDVLGETGGAKTVTLTTANMAAHTHSGTTASETQEHTHSGSTGTESADHGHSGSTGGISANHTHGLNGLAGLNQGNGFGHGRAGGGVEFGMNYSTGTVSSDHSHSFSTGGRSAAHTHSFTTGGRSATHNHTYTTDNGTGTASPVANLQPYIVLNYIIKT
jgi:microcystin-dependent protein